MRQNNAVQTVNLNGRQTDPSQRNTQPAIAPEDGQQPKHRHDHRQNEGRAQNGDQYTAPGEMSSRKRAGHRDRQCHAETGRQYRLKNCKSNGRPVRRTQAIARLRPPENGGDCTQNDRGDQSRRGKPKGRAYWLSAPSHSAKACSRRAGASSAGTISALSGVISVSNPSGKPSAGVTAGYIQFVVGITD